MKRLSKKAGVLCAIALCVMSSFGANTITVNAATPAAEESVKARSTNLSWVYAYIDGVYCMRLYNHSTGQWETDWIPV